VSGESVSYDDTYLIVEVVKLTDDGDFDAIIQLDSSDGRRHCEEVN
jgi:hypothetical protein